ncbi:hypothetical protein [Curtobacterium sp. PhB136]|uniref:hypothetical protein n=1 Tax=Curtobacterium sp. PhB136 TaxID=2485181 RepID=UPI0010492032|nr:hypothetical protein [Curtobacterium sp. PhB136]TCK64326.1 hypothetical protein EDF27_1575 [Curtobacterium sp. PhB136]
MSEGAFGTGWRVYRAHRREFLDPVRLRCRTIVGAAVAFVAGAVLVVTDLPTPWTGSTLAASLVMAVAWAAAVGCFSAAFTRSAGRVPVPSGPRLVGWRRSERIGRQFAARPPELLPEDRDEVLAKAAETIGPAIGSIDRLRWVPLGWLAVWIGALVSGLAWQSVIALLFPPASMLLQGGVWIAAVVWLGRAELTRRRVEATPPYTPPPPNGARNTEPRGSKLALPDA